ncbi:MAG: RNA polymerase sigma factor [bacterium]
MESTVKNIHQDLIDACKRGSREAQFKLYKLYYKSMYNTCLRIVNDTAEAEDIMQESFLDAFRKINYYTGEGTFGSWLKRIMVNNALDTLRKRRDQTSIEEAGIDFADEEDQASEEEIQLQVQEIKLAIEKLPEDYRIILSLILFEGYDHEEVCEILKITYNNSRTRFSRARQRLLEIIQESRLTRTIIYN